MDDLSWSKWKHIEKNLPKIKEMIEQGEDEKTVRMYLGVSRTTWCKYKKERGILGVTLAKAYQTRREESIVPRLMATAQKLAFGYTEQDAEVVEIIHNSSDKEKKPILVSIKKTTKKIPPNAQMVDKLLKHYTKNDSKKDRYVDNPQELSIKEQRLSLEKEAFKIKKEKDEWD